VTVASKLRLHRNRDFDGSTDTGYPASWLYRCSDVRTYRGIKLPHHPTFTPR
jgi:hypothetical protein